MASQDPEQNQIKDPQQPPQAGLSSGVSPASTHGSDANSFPSMLGRYEIVAELGAGAMGTVYRGRDKVLERDVAIKVPKLENSEAQAQMLQRFYREARAVARLSHPSICPIYDVGEIDGKVFIAMGYVKGSTLDREVGKGRFLEPLQAAKLIERICGAMQHAHDNQVVHRDLKTANIMIDADGVPVLLDFGLAMLRDETDSGVTHQGQILGSPAYMSPEQVNGRRVDHRSDIFSLGVVFYETLTGRRPYLGNVPQVMMGIAKGVCDAPADVNSDVPPELSDLCLKMMATSLKHRFQSMAECAEAISRYQARTLSGMSDSVGSPDLVPNPRAMRTSRATGDGHEKNGGMLQDLPPGSFSRKSTDVAAPTRRRAKANASELRATEETQPVTAATVRSLWQDALDTAPSATKRASKKVQQESVQRQWWQFRWLIAVVSLCALSGLSLIFVLRAKPENATTVKPPSESNATVPAEPAKTEPKKTESTAVVPSESFSLDELDSPK